MTGTPWLVDPVDTAAFERDFYERELCRIHRDSPDYYRELLTVADLDTVLGSHGVSYPDISLVAGDTDIASSEYTNDAGKINHWKSSGGSTRERRSSFASYTSVYPPWPACAWRWDSGSRPGFRPTSI